MFLSVTAIFGGWLLHNHSSYDFSTLSGSKIQHDDLRGKWVVVNYFAEWCAPCLREIPQLNLLNSMIESDSVALFGISFDAIQDNELMLLKEKYSIEYPLINSVKKPFPFEMPSYLPATFLLRPDGSVAGQLLGEQEAHKIIEAIEQQKAILADAASKFEKT